jgi:hypothetical protein
VIVGASKPTPIRRPRRSPSARPDHHPDNAEPAEPT